MPPTPERDVVFLLEPLKQRRDSLFMPGWPKAWKNRSKKTWASPFSSPLMFAPTHETKPASRFARSVSMVGHFPLFSRYEVDYNNMESVVRHACLHRLAKK